MRFFTNIMHDTEADQAEIAARFEAYYKHLEAIRSRLPASAYDFAAAPWHYDDGEHGLHDSWVESMVIEEIAAGERHQERSIQIRVALLSAYHDRHIELVYRSVRKYELRSPSQLKSPPSYKTGHGDWLYDELDVSGAGLVVHEVRFSSGTQWLIECEDVEMTSASIEPKDCNTDCPRSPSQPENNS